MVANEGVKTLGRMAGVKSLARNLRTEDEAYEKELLGRQPQRREEMEIMAAGPVTINNYGPPPEAKAPPASSPAAASPAAPVASPAAEQPGMLKKAGLAAVKYGLPLVLGAGGLAAYNAATKPVPAVTADPTPLDLLPPDQRPKE